MFIWVLEALISLFLSYLVVVWMEHIWPAQPPKPPQPLPPELRRKYGEYFPMEVKHD